MKTREPGQLSYLLIGIGLAVVGGLISALLARQQMRNLLRKRGRQSLNFLKQHATNLREAAEDAAKKAKAFVGPHRDSVKTDTAAEKQTYQEEKRETLGG